MEDTIFDALANEHRRTLLVALLEENPQKAAELAPSGQDIAGLETNLRVDTELHHIHLPKLEEYAYIHWDRDAQEITKGPLFEDIRPLLECVDNHV